jgi:2-amino-4-hydroxy-6-hydroxymethyldihydropteridine diphosphokinase
VSETVRAWIGLGSNLQQPAQQLTAAFDALGAICDTQLLRHSHLYRTPPWGRLDQPEFVNAVAELRTGLNPRELLEELQSIERAAGRARVERWGPRVLDLDLLLYGDLDLHDEGLQLPHPHLAERAFVLLPLCELEPELRIGPDRTRVCDLLAALDCSGIEALG